MHLGIWHQVLKDKYIPHTPVITWLCLADPSVLSGSQTWNNLINALPLLVHWLALKPRSRVSIITGKVEILGLGKGFFLSTELINHLNEHQVFYLYQARSAPTLGTFYTKWLNYLELGLEGELTDEWESYRHRLIDASITLSKEQDELRWTGGDCTGILSTRNVYNALAAELWKNINGGM
jgi:hypothetical protein